MYAEVSKGKIAPVLSKELCAVNTYGGVKV
jgi:hypothetical protein